uniref:C4b-binding protein alpha chain-like isoform X3 n=1 Tax=Pristiophorus japonicus TaxID=55135 RepID=UPI00398E9CFE
MAERLILALMVICTAAVARVTGDCGSPQQLENGSPTDEFISGKSFPVGTRLRYKCYEGYTFKQGSSMFVTCSQDSEWTPLKAICEPSDCGNPGELLNGNYEAAATTFGNKAIFVCNPGYHLVGRSYLLCKADGWDGQVPTCETVKCDDPPPIDNGRVSTRTSNWEYGTEAEYSCIDNYSLIGKGSITCTVTGQWDMSPPTCKVVECRRPESSAHISIVSGFGPTYKYKNSIIYRCDAGYEMVGSSVIECSEDNTFVPPPPTCKLVTATTTAASDCGNPGELLNGNYEAAATTFGNKAIFVCNPGYHLVGRSYLLCKADGWDGQVPTCETVKCDDPPPIDNGRVSTRTSNWEYGTEAEYSCIDNYSLIGKGSITCTVTGQWDMSPPTCKVVECRRPESSAHIRIRSGFGPTYKYKNSIIYRCDAGYEMVGSSVIECSEDDSFVPPPPTCKLAGATTAVTATTTAASNCGNPGELLNGYFEAAATTFGNKAIFFCNPGYHLVGRSYLLCKADGWDGQVPTCETVKCDDPPPIDNGRVSTRTSNWEYGTEAEYSCIDNYSLIGKGSITCTVTGQWDMSPPTCKVLQHAPKLAKIREQIIAPSQQSHRKMG